MCGWNWKEKNKEKHLNKPSLDILVTEVGTHKMSQTTFLNNSANNWFLSLFFFFLERIGNTIIELGFQNTVPISHSNNSEVILLQDRMKKGRYRTTYAIWYLLLKDTNVNHNLKHHYLKLKLPFLNECKSDPCLQHFLKASERLVSPCPEPFFCSWFHRHLILKKPWAYNCPVKRVSNPLWPSKRDQAREGSAPCPQWTHLSITHSTPTPGTTLTLAAPGSMENCWEERRFWGFTALQGFPQLSHEAHTFPFGLPAVVTQE